MGRPALVALSLLASMAMLLELVQGTARAQTDGAPETEGVGRAERAFVNQHRDRNAPATVEEIGRAHV